MGNVGHLERRGLTRPRAFGIRVAATSIPQLAFLCIAVPVAADVLPNYVITEVPDFDQKRDQLAEPFRKGLPPNNPNQCTGDPTIDCKDDGDCGFDEPCFGTGGAMYCFPTSAISWMAYLANHGYPQVDPGPASDWESMDVYNLVGDAIEQMGVLMETTGNGGTKGEEGRLGLRDWLAPQFPLFSVVRHAKQETYCPRLEHLAKAGLSGQLVIAGIGYYYLSIARETGGDFWTRNGGHLMPFRRAVFEGNPLVRRLGYVNPFSSDSTYEQSPFSDRITTLEGVTSMFRAGEGDPFYDRTQDRLTGWTGRPTFLDSYTAIVPMSLITAVPFGPDAPGLKRINPVPVPPTNIPLDQTIPSPTGTKVIDGAFLPSFTDALLITEGDEVTPDRLWEVDLVTRDTVEIVLPDEPGLIVTQRFPLRANAVNKARSRMYYIVDRSVLVDIPLPSASLADAMTYDDANDQVLVLSASTSELLVYPADLSTSPTILSLPTVIAPTGGVDIDVTPDGQEVWIVDTAGGAIYRLTYAVVGGGLVVTETIPCCDFAPPSGTASRPDEQPEKLIIGGSGYAVILLNTGSVLELEESRTGGWLPTTNPLLTGHAASGFIDIVRSRTNFDPATMTGPAWRHVLPIDEFGEEEALIPTLSVWGLGALTLALLSAATVIVARRQRNYQTT
ncbi:MAG: hypothetical protein IH989_04325 [Planctomycetes bacterium]|nr:hypothetical protein [Planctomycetota bacterium]